MGFVGPMLGIFLESVYLGGQSPEEELVVGTESEIAVDDEFELTLAEAVGVACEHHRK
jgi:hypothetical protein